MIKLKYYRFIKTLFGHRSFVKDGPKGKTHILIKGPGTQSVCKKFIEDGYTEEWPLS